ncbi:hypothetical protein [Enteractinococcus coprophilus]|uniref:Uncharacterized protein n=1 Tax=Enteractinococcus coprophilus TaxID=1027633 RepID=A0A543ANP9_9MICC|nr:hypothetical protein [Enteractinococcus coprophilus]TQL74201.1 hypothetical protein FB556_0655 [Enteractinococcus coprophilus]
MTEYQIDTENILARHRQLSGLKSLASSAQKLQDRSFELYGPTNMTDFAKWVGLPRNLTLKPQFGQLIEAHQLLITRCGVYGWLQVLLTGAVYQYQRDYNMGGRTADTTYLSRQYVDDVCRLGTHIVLNYGAPTVANRKLLAHFMSGNYARLVDRILPAVGAELGQELRPETLEEGASPIFRLPQQVLQMAVVHELDMRPMDADEPVQDDGFAYRPTELVQHDVSTLQGAAQQMIYELTMMTRALQEGAAPAPWDDPAVVRARLEATMGVAWASQCLDPHPEVDSEEHRHMYIEDLVGRVEKIQERGIIGTISADIFQTRQIVEEARSEDPATVMLYERAMRQSVDNAAWVIFNWVPDLPTAGFLAQLLLDYQFDAFFSETETM